MLGCITELKVVAIAFVVCYMVLICTEKHADCFVCFTSISKGCCSENIHVSITLETIGYIGGAHSI